MQSFYVLINMCLFCQLYLSFNLHLVFQVLETLVHFGAPQKILVDGKPHLGTDKLVPLLQNFRRYLEKLGVSNL